MLELVFRKGRNKTGNQLVEGDVVTGEDFCGGGGGPDKGPLTQMIRTVPWPG